MPTDGLAAAVRHLPASWRGHYFDAVDSTQDEARAAAQSGAPARSVYVADYQRAGRGRQGRTWLAAPGTALLVSVLFREPDHQPHPWRYTSLTSLALAEAIEATLPGVRPEIKWPNDVMLGDGRKVAGILAETTWDGHELVAIVGVGVNINTDASDLADLPTATSLRLASGRPVDRGEVLLELIKRIDRRLQQSAAEVHAAWEQRLWGRNQRLRLLDLGREEDVVIVGADPDGTLHVRLADGTQRRTTTGELLL